MTRVANSSKSALLPVVVQHARTGQIRMLAYVNAEALAVTRQTGYAHFFSRSRNSLWKKGEASGNVLRIVDINIDCDGDTLLYSVLPEGPTCHLGDETCFDDGINGISAWPTLVHLEATLQQRRKANADKSYTQTLLHAGPTKIAAKIAEEAGELGQALQHESDARVVSETADVLFHAMVGLTARNIGWTDVLAELQKRSGKSGLTEKAERAQE